MATALLLKKLRIDGKEFIKADEPTLQRLPRRD